MLKTMLTPVGDANKGTQKLSLRPPPPSRAGQPRGGATISQWNAPSGSSNRPQVADREVSGTNRQWHHQAQLPLEPGVRIPQRSTKLTSTISLSSGDRSPETEKTMAPQTSKSYPLDFRDLKGVGTLVPLPLLHCVNMRPLHCTCSRDRENEDRLFSFELCYGLRVTGDLN